MLINVTAATEIFVFHDPVNFNMGFAGMIGFCRRILDLEPMNGAYFLFRSKLGQQIRVLTYDGDGWWLATKKFSHGSVRYWPKTLEAMSQIEAREFLLLLLRGDLQGARLPELWKKIG